MTPCAAAAHVIHQPDMNSIFYVHLSEDQGRLRLFGGPELIIK
jgi:hypothetical protein